jgi:hypothetical protein
LLPAWIILALFLLRGEGGVLKALAFAAGAMTVRVVQGVLFGFVFSEATDASGEGGSDLITSTLLLVLGILVLISAVKKWRKEEDPDAPPPKWMETLGGLSAIQAFGMGIVDIIGIRRACADQTRVRDGDNQREGCAAHRRSPSPSRRRLPWSGARHL